MSTITFPTPEIAAGISNLLISLLSYYMSKIVNIKSHIQQEKYYLSLVSNGTDAYTMSSREGLQEF